MFVINCAILALLLLKASMGVGAAMFSGGRQEAQEVEQRPCEGAKSSEGMTFQSGFRKWLMGFDYLYVFRHVPVCVHARCVLMCTGVY
jgi:hypothetical protein